MSSPKHERDSDRESLTDWTLVDREGTPDKTTHEGPGKDDDKDSGKSSSSPFKEEAKEEKQDEEDKEKKAAANGEEEDAEELSEDLISMGKRVQEIKACSGSDSSDIETLECPSPDDGYEDSNQGHNSLHSSLLSSSISGGFTFVEEADEGDVESLASSDVMVLDQEGKAGVDEETDLSLASSPSLPDDLPAIKPDTQYRHTPDKDFNSRLNIVVALTLACVLGLGLGHFLGWSSRSLWQENLNSAQVRRLRELQDDLLSCINSPPQGEVESRGPEYIPATSFIPVLSETEAEGSSNVDTFVESLVVPLEETGVVLDSGKTLHHHQDDSHTYRHIHKSMEPTFATLDLLYSSSDPPMDQEETHSGLPDVPLATAVGDEIESVPEMTRTQELLPELLTTRAQEPVPEPVTTRAQEPEPLTTRKEEPALEETVAASPTNTPPLKHKPEHLSVPLEQQGAEEPGLQSAVYEEDVLPAVAVENSQIVEALNLENEQLKTEITRLQQENVSPIKISGKDGKDARNLRERITHLLEDNEELRVAVLRQQFDGLPDGDTQAFNSALSTNHKLRLSVGKLTHLVPDLTTLKESANDLQKENQELQKQVGKLRYQEQPLPQELNVMAREVENLKKVVDEASKKKKPPANYENAKMYLALMSQVLQTLHDFKEGDLVEKLDVATDVFEGLVPGNVKPSASVQQKMNVVRGKFRQLKASLAAKWEKIKELSQPQHLSQVSQDTLGKMNRVVVNVVNKMKDIGQASIMKRGKASLESTASTLAQSLAALGDQFDKTWKNLEAQVDTEGKEATSDLLVEGEEVISVEEEVMDEGEGKAKERGSKEVKEVSETKNQAPDKAKKVDRSGGSGGSGRGGGRDRGQDGDDKTEAKGKKSKEKVEKKEKPDGRKDRSRSRSGEEENKEKKKKKKEEKKKDNKEKSKKDKENKKIKEKEASGHKKEVRESRKSLEREDKRYYKGQYNKYDKKQHQQLDDDNDDITIDESDDEPKPSRKLHKQKVYDDDEDEDDSYKRKYQPKPEKDDDDDKKKGLLRHWEKPSRKNYRREYPGPKKAFIRRRGKNSTVHLRDEALEWMERRATGREVRRKEEHKSDWVFDRARQRTDHREMEKKSEWQFEHARDRREQRGVQGEEKQINYERNHHEKHEERPAKGRYVRFDDDDDDDYEFYRDYHHHHHQGRGRGEHKHPNKKGKREWVIPNFSATGKTFYH